VSERSTPGARVSVAEEQHLRPFTRVGPNQAILRAFVVGVGIARRLVMARPLPLARPTRLALASLLALLLSAGALACSPGDPKRSACPAGAVCDTGTPSGPVHGVAADGTVDVTAAEAWPSRPPEPAPLTPAQLANACAIEGACLLDPSTGAPFADDVVAFLVQLCTAPSGAEERVIPESGSNERWSWKHRAALSSGGSCDVVRGLTTPAIGIHCEEDGCWWDGAGSGVPVPTTTCSGDVATLHYAGRTMTRDCSHTYTRCDPTSATGCTDRAPVACDPAGSDKCDGDSRLGCDHAGRVSFHDCSRYPGGHCQVTATGPACVYPDATSGCDASKTGCNGDVLSLCVAGALQQVDCRKLGLAGCGNRHCYAR
jgi:hypothetical protein